MKMYGMDLAEGSEIGNITVPTGTSFPANPNAGEMFFRTDLDKTYMHNGTDWAVMGGDGVPTDITIDEFTGDGIENQFTMSQAPVNENDILVFTSGIRQQTIEYAISGTTLTFGFNPVGDIEVVHLPVSITGRSFESTEVAVTSGQTNITVDYLPDYTMVFLNGMRLVEGTDFTATSGTSIILTEAPSVDSIMDVVSFSVFQLADHYTKAEADTLRPNNNYIINPSFNINQRGFAGGVAGSNVYTFDRWVSNCSNSPSISLPDVDGFITLSDYVGNEGLQQRIEYFGTTSQEVTLSWEGTAQGQFYHGDGNNAWSTQASSPLTFTLAASSGLLVTDVIEFIQFGNGTINNIKLELGSVATKFEPRHTEEEIALCKRYFEKSYNLLTSPGAATNAGAVIDLQPRNIANASVGFRFSVEKRSQPTVVIYSTITGASGVADNSGDRGASAQAVGTSGARYVSIATGTASSNINFHWTADAEL